MHWLHLFDFSNVSLNRLPNRKDIRAGCPYVAFLHCVFSNVYSKCLHKRKQSCTEFVHLFLCVFSSVISNHLPERRHICTSCIYLACLQCVFSNVCSKRLHKRIQSGIGCIIFSTFLQWVLSNVFSNSQPGRR